MRLARFSRLLRQQLTLVGARRSLGQPTALSHPHLLRPRDVIPGFSAAVFADRRQALFELARQEQADAKQHVIIVPSASKCFMAPDVPFLFRQSADFLYLTGFQEPDALLVLSNVASDASKPETTLFVRERDAARELWEGPCSGSSGAQQLLQIERSYSNDQFPRMLKELAESHPDALIWLDLHPINPSPSYARVVKLLRETSRAFVNPRHLIHRLRAVKSDQEVAHLRRACSIASDAFRETMRASHARVHEHLLYAKFDYECRIRGAEYLAYIPVVAGGDRATTIHYIRNDAVVRENELVLMDAGCQYANYCSDITRTWPVSGVFRPGQRDLYEAVLAVQQQLVRLCAPGVSLQQLHEQMLRLLGAELVRLRILPEGGSDAALQHGASQFCPHFIGHHLGMDIHDCDSLSRSQPLVAGNCVTVEPGIYVPRQLTTVSARYRGVGIRIEDNIAITAAGHENLSAAAPKEVHDLDKLLAVERV